MNQLDHGLEISDLPNEIIASIFSHLPLADLINMYDVSLLFRDIMEKDSRLRNPQFQRVVLRRFNLMSDCRVKRPYAPDGYIIVEGFRLILKFLRIFGHFIVTLSIRCSDSSDYYQYRVFEYILDFSRLYLKELSMSFVTCSLNSLPVRSFARVDLLIISSCRFSAYLCNLVVLFPRAKEITIRDSSEIENVDRLVRRYPYLEYMKVCPLTLNKNYFYLLGILNWQAFLAHHD